MQVLDFLTAWISCRKQYGRAGVTCCSTGNLRCSDDSGSIVQVQSGNVLPQNLDFHPQGRHGNPRLEARHSLAKKILDAAHLHRRRLRRRHIVLGRQELRSLLATLGRHVGMLWYQRDGVGILGCMVGTDFYYRSCWRLVDFAAVVLGSQKVTRLRFRW